MEPPPTGGGRSAQAPNRSLLNRALTLRRDSRDTEQDEPPKGPLGLTCLYLPPTSPAIVDLIFVHGLNGGSQSTWTHGRDLSHYWPKTWLPRDEAFKDARIHTFGYSSAWGQESILDLADFSRSLLAAIHDAPEIPRTGQVSADSMPTSSLGRYVGNADPNSRL
jgi:hypothetical protein